MNDNNTFIKRLSALQEVFVLDNSISKIKYMPLDLSVQNDELKKVDMSNPESVETHINQLLNASNKQVAFGGYLEQRNLYDRSSHFGQIDHPRNIHLGVDMWTNAGTAVLAALDGAIHSFQNNNNFGDYGPTIIVEHLLDSVTFYTLYGHLSLESITDIQVGQQVHKSEKIGELGASEVNGDYAPHLHFQLILDLEGKGGDYPGVCSQRDLDWYKRNCPDPTPMLGLV